MEGDGVSEELDFVCIVLPIGIAYWPLLFPCGRTGPCYSLVEEQGPVGHFNYSGRLAMAAPILGMIQLAAQQ